MQRWLAPASALTLSLASPVLAASEQEGTANLFAGSLYQSIAAIIAFVLLLLILRKYAWGPILNGLQEREAKIKDDLEQAEKARREADEKLEELDRRMAEAHREASQIIEKAREDALKVARGLREQNEAELKAMRERAESEIRVAKEQAVKEIFAQAATLSTQIAGRILGREIRAEDQQELVNQSLNELTRNMN